jgi:hypothetical protein
LKKQNLGQFNTKNDVWLQPQVVDFIRHSGCVFGVDPFAGAGDLVRSSKELGLKQVMGYDIDTEINAKYGWWWNNSLENIPPSSPGTIVITNPPYLAKNSANRNDYEGYKYFIEHPEYDDLYQIALFRVLAKYKYSVFIIPETYFLTEFFKNDLHSITILEDNPFEDTDCPVCVACFEIKNDFMSIAHNNYDIYKNDQYIFNNETLKDILSDFNTKTNLDMTFNEPRGNLGLRAVDGTDPGDRIRFCRPEELDYDLSDIKESSRAITVLSVPFVFYYRMLNILNLQFEFYRVSVRDLMLAPFKNNNKLGERRRRLDYALARQLINKTVEDLTNENSVLS